MISCEFIIHSKPNIIDLSRINISLIKIAYPYLGEKQICKYYFILEKFFNL